MKQLFNLGQVVHTPGVRKALGNDPEADQSMADVLTRHVSGDWGDMDAEDKAANDESVKDKGRIVSAYKLTPIQSPERDAVKVWVITEWDRSVTTILLPEEY
jgi:phosphoribosylformylglycinamidine (FGAM) synthase-like enzyme